MGRLTYGMAAYLNAQRIAETPEACEVRRLEIKAAESAKDDMHTRFPSVTPETFEAVDRYYKDRLNHYRRQYGVHKTDV